MRVYNLHLYFNKVKLGEYYNLHTKFKTIKHCKFIRTTRKGFNFLHTDGKRLVSTKGHFYDKKYTGKDIPKNQQIFNITSTWIIQSSLCCDCEGSMCG